MSKSDWLLSVVMIVLNTLLFLILCVVITIDQISRGGAV